MKNASSSGKYAAKVWVTFRATPEEKNRLAEQADMAGLSISEYMRRREFGGRPIWATQQLREFIVKRFVLDDERLKNPDQPFDYFEELLRRIQDILTSERRFYQKITDIYATSVDYDPTTEESITFFKTVQNKLHRAVTGQTAAEIIHSRADSAKPHMGLTTWRGAKVRKQDVGITKNYLS